MSSSSGDLMTFRADRPPLADPSRRGPAASRRRAVGRPERRRPVTSLGLGDRGRGNRRAADPQLRRLVLRAALELTDSDSLQADVRPPGPGWKRLGHLLGGRQDPGRPPPGHHLPGADQHSGGDVRPRLCQPESALGRAGEAQRDRQRQAGSQRAVPLGERAGRVRPRDPARARGRLVLPAHRPARRSGEPDGVRAESRAAGRGEETGGDVQRRGGDRRGQAGADRARRVPAGPDPVHTARGADATRGAPVRPTGNRQDAPGARGGWGGRRSVLSDLGLDVRRDDRRRGRRPRARPVHEGEGGRSGDHLHRRAGCHRSLPRRRNGRRLDVTATSLCGCCCSPWPSARGCSASASGWGAPPGSTSPPGSSSSARAPPGTSAR
jgi:hypothetical protein